MIRDQLIERRIIVSHQAQHLAVDGFRQDISERFRSQAWYKRHVDYVVITIGDKKHWLLRIVDQQVFVLDVVLQRRGNADTAKRLLHTC